MDEIDLRYNELVNMLDKLRLRVNELENADPTSIQNAISELSEDVERSKKSSRMIEMMCRALEPSRKSQWKAKLKEENVKLKQIVRDIEWAKTTDKQHEGSNSSAVSTDPQKMTEADFTGYGKKMMEEIKDTTDVTLQVIAETKVTAIETATKLKEQTEQMERVHDAAFEIEGTLARTAFIVKRMLRRTATDRYIWFLTFLIVCAIIGIIVLRIVNDDIDIDNEDTILSNN